MSKVIAVRIMMDLRVYPSESAAVALVVAHGAGAGQTSPFLVRTARGLAARGVSCATFDFAYMESGRRVPDPAPVLEARWRDALASALKTFAGLPLFIGGKSMGGRIASHVATQGAEGIAGLVFLGYPLHPPGKPGQRRDAHLPAIEAPMLFVQGSRDAFGTADEIRQLLPRLRRATLHEVAGADHSFKVGRGAADPFDGILDIIAQWTTEERKKKEG
jgi:predicted alpha/beta-hydrolase family hydrolase